MSIFVFPPSYFYVEFLPSLKTTKQASAAIILLMNLQSALVAIKADMSDREIWDRPFYRNIRNEISQLDVYFLDILEAFPEAA